MEFTELDVVLLGSGSRSGSPVAWYASDVAYAEPRPPTGPHSTEPVVHPGTTLFDLDIEAVLVLSTSGRVTDASAAMVKLLGTTKETLVGSRPPDWLTEEDSDATMSELMRAGEGPREWMDRWRRSDGKVLTLSWKAQLSRKSGRIIAVARDRTESLRPGEDATEFFAERIHAIDRRSRVFQRNWEQEKQVEADAAASGADQYEKVVSGWRKWLRQVGPLGGLIGTIFSAGVAWAVFAGANATDAEVDVAVDGALKAHNGGMEETAIDPADGEPYGPHPELHEAVQENAKAINALTENQAKDAEQDTRMNKRVRYLYELGRWESQSLDRQRRGLKPKPRPDRLDALESELIND